METTTIVAPSERKYNDIGKTGILFQLAKPSGLVFPNYPPTEMIPPISQVLFIPEKLDEEGEGTGEGDEEHAYERTLAYSSGKKSIYFDEWTEEEQKEFWKKKKSIQFKNGFKSISTREKTLLNYIRMAGFNKANNETRIGSDVLYREVDYEEESINANKVEEKLIEAKYFVMKGDINEVRAYAEALCKTQAEVEELHGRKDNEVRYRLRSVANATPEIFVSGFTDETMKNQVPIIRAIQQEIIGADEKDTKLHWVTNGKVFFEAPSGTKVIPYFAELASKNEKYTKLLNSIKEMMNVDPEEEEVKLDWVDTLIQQSLNNEVIVRSGLWYVINDESDSENPKRFNGDKNMRTAIETNEDGIIAFLSERNKLAEQE